MKTSESIIVNDDIDFLAAGRYLLRSWYILVIAVLIGSVLGFFWGKSRKPLYEMQATLSIPQSWQYLAQYPDSIMYQLGKEYLTKEGNGASIMWISRPVDGSGNLMNSLVAIDLKAADVNSGEHQFESILAGFRNDSGTKYVFDSAKKTLDNKKKEVVAAKQLFVNSTSVNAQNYSEAIKKYDDEIAKVSQLSSSPEEISWLTKPAVVSTNMPKSLLFYVGIAATVGGIAGILVVLLPRLKNVS